MPARQFKARLGLDRPQRVRRRDRAQWVERLGDDAVDQRIDPDALLPDPAAGFRRRLPAIQHVEDHAAQDLAVRRRQLAGEEHDRVGAGSVTRKQELGELGRIRPGRPGVWPVVGIGLIAAIGGVRYGAARGDEQPLEFVPLRDSVDAGADALNLYDFVDDRPVAEAFDENRIRLARGKGGDPPAALWTPRGSRDGDAAHGLAARERLTDEQVVMSLQEAAGAELEDWELGQISLRAGPLVAGPRAPVHSDECGGLIFSAISG